MTRLTQFTELDYLHIKEIHARILEQREEILTAFLAKYGVEADKVEQVINVGPQGMSWYLKIKE